MQILIYIASLDSEGSLGSLSDLSKLEKLYSIFLRALEGFELCSFEYHCSDEDFELQPSGNGAACHDAYVYLKQPSFRSSYVNPIS